MNGRGRRPASFRRDVLATLLAQPDPALAGAQEPVWHTPAPVWLPAGQVWIELDELPPGKGEQLIEGLESGSRTFRVRMLWRDGVSAAMRLALPGGRVLQIVGGPAEIGRREGIALLCVETTARGEGL